MDKQGSILKTIELLYGSILEEHDLSSALRMILNLTGSSGAAYLQLDTRANKTLHCDTVDVDLVAQASYEKEMSAIDPRIPAARIVPVGEIFGERSLLDDRILKASEIYDFLLRNDIPHIMAVMMRRDSGTFTSLSLQRSLRQGAYSNEQAETLSHLLPHLICAYRIRGVLASARQSQKTCMEVIHRLPFGVILLSGSARPLEISHVAQQVIAKKDALKYEGGHIHAIHIDDDRKLQKAIFEATNSLEHPRCCADTISLRRKPPLRPLAVSIAPIFSPHLFDRSQPACILVISDGSHTPDVTIKLVRNTLLLTKAESELACVLFSGVSLREAARRLDLSVNTCKTQLKSIYSKTGCRSHAELVKMLTMASTANSVLAT